MPALSDARARTRAGRTLPLALAAVLVGGLGAAVPSYAAPAVPADPPGPSSQAAEQAQDALSQAQEALGGEGGEADVDPTIALNELAPLVDDLDGSDRAQAEEMLARPTEPGADPWGLDYEGRTPVTECAAHVCVNYVTGGPNRASAKWARRVLAAAEQSWAAEVGRLGYRAPLRDGGRSAGQGDNAKLDVYVGDIGGQGIFGYAVPDRPKARTSSTYLVVDEDYREFPGKPVELLRATVAHELFHAVQFAYDRGEDSWLLEATATWMEDEVFDSINDNYNYLSQGSLARPGQSLDHPSGVYGNWIFFRYVSERFGASTIRSIWERARGTYSVPAVHRALTARGSSLPDAYSAFSGSNNALRDTYEEGGAYAKFRPSGIVPRFTLSTSRRGTGPESTTLKHLGSRSYAIAPGASLTGRWRLRIRVDGPDTVSRGYLLVHRRDGSVARRTFSLRGNGNGREVVAFRRGEVRKVTLNLANTSMNYRCNTGGNYACNGSPVANKRRFEFSARAIR